MSAEADAAGHRYWRRSRHLDSDSLDWHSEIVVEAFVAALDSVAAVATVLAAVAFVVAAGVAVAAAAADEAVVVAAERLAAEIEYSFALSRSGRSKRPVAVGNCAEMPPWG